MSWPRAVTLRTDRLSLGPLTERDANEMVPVLAPTELYRFTGGEPPTLEQLEARYRRQARGRSLDGRAGWLNWILRPVAGGPPVGFVQATLTHEAVGVVADLAWLVTASEQARGLAGEATSAVATWLTSIGVGRLQACVRPGHVASERVAQRIGLSPTSTVVDGEILWRAVTAPPTDEGAGVRLEAP
jgi:RimJ/RimL family protein N-acetyltransferase